MHGNLNRKRTHLNHVWIVKTAVGILSEYECLSGQTSHECFASPPPPPPPASPERKRHPLAIDPAGILPADLPTGRPGGGTTGSFTVPPTCPVLAASRPLCSMLPPVAPPFSLGLSCTTPVSPHVAGGCSSRFTVGGLLPLVPAVLDAIGT